MEALLAPKSVAVIGASDHPDRIGGRPVSYMLEAGFSGRIYPVNPNRETVQGLPAYPSIRDVPEAPDACVVAVPAAIVPETLEDCAERGVRSVVVFSAGFAEAGEVGRSTQDRIAQIAEHTGMRVVGPNCLGVFNARTRWIGTFASPIRRSLPVPGPFSIASQSGAVGSEILSLLRQKRLETGIWITTGNEADVDMADAIGYLVSDPDTKIIVAYAEGVRHGRKLRTALEWAAEADKPVIFMKTGRSKAGAAAVQAHTAALAGSERVYQALFRQLGVIEVRTFEELADAAYIASFPQRPTGRRLAIVSISGGVGVQMVDAATDLGLEVPELPADVQAELKALVPFASPRNPVDVTAQVFNDFSLVGRNLRIILREGDFDVATLYLTSVVAFEETSRELIAELDQVMADFPDVPLLVSLSAPPKITRLYENAGYPVFQDPTRAVKAAAVLGRIAEVRGRSVAAPPTRIHLGAIRLADLAVQARGQERTALAEHEAMEVLTSWAIPCVSGRPTHSEATTPETEAAAEEVAVGVWHDPTFGPVVSVGLGGVLAEVLDDAAVRLAPFGPDEAHRMISELAGARLLQGFRERPASDVPALAKLLADLSMFAAVENGAFERLDLNPIRVLPRGLGVVVLGADLELPRTEKLDP